MTAFLDTNVVIALLDKNNRWHAWSVKQMEKNRTTGPVLISDIVYCESGVAMQHQAELDRAIRDLGIERSPPRDDALFRAGAAFMAYREKRREAADPATIPKRVLPDMIIGALAEVFNLPLLTANPKDFKPYFPNVELITPKTHP